MNRIFFVLVMGLFSFLFGSRAQSEPPTPKLNPVDAGRALRQMVLTMPPAEIGVKPSEDFPRVFGILMDWPIGEQTATVFSDCTGGASLYTTSTFGIIGGEGHETVRAAAIRFVRGADRLFDSATPTSEFPYPAVGRVRFYLLTFEGVRVVDTDLASIKNGTSKFAEFFGLGQDVLTQLRLVVQKGK